MVGPGADGSPPSGPPGGTQPGPSLGHVVAYPGGTSIAIRWDGVAGSNGYEIARNGTVVFTQTPGYHADFPEKDGNGYIDRNVTPGVQYEYTVTALASSRTPVGSVQTMLGSTTTPPPALTLDTSKATDLAGWMQNTVQPFLETWYPKIGDAFAQPDYMPPHALTVVVDPNIMYLAQTDGQTITINATYARAHPEDLGVFLYQAVPVLQNYADLPGWIASGMSDYTREFVLHDRDSTQPGPGNTYLTGGTQGSYFLAWVQSEHAAKLVHDVNVLAHNNSYTDGYFVTRTGKTIDQLWGDMVGAPPAAAVTFAQMSGKCLQAGDASTTNLEISTCNGDMSQTFGVVHNSDGTIAIAHGSDCVDVQSSSAADGATIWLYGCNATGAQDWIQQADGSLKNPESGKCAGLPNGTTDGSSLVLAPCDGSTGQRLSPL
jgi:hypothetical protein